jgi:uncharacterized membrane protein YeiB
MTAEPIRPVAQSERINILDILRGEDFEGNPGVSL